ncbi:MAG: putative patatin [Solirubrobacterales bacterium]|nr:putative patatin [Solirubrobacterales bacterium]
MLADPVAHAAVAADARQPVRWLPSDDRAEPTRGTGLCLSGGGYRAMLFHVGSLRRLNQVGLLAGVDRISSVSGGSITAAALALAWPVGDDADFVARVDTPVRALACHTIDEEAIAVGILTPGSIGEHVASAYRRHLVGERTLQDLPDHPRFVFNATNLGSGALWRFSKPYMADWRVGTIREPTLPLASAVAASSAFPPVLSPFTLDLRDAAWDTVEGNELTRQEFRDRVVLSDGGIYDNLGLETVWKKCATVLVSDAGGHTPDEDDPPADWIRQSVRILHVLDKQVRDLRKRQVQAGFADGLRRGAYWGIRGEHPADAPLLCPSVHTLRLADLPTRLKALDDVVQERLINWGYAACDATLRRYVDPSLPAPAAFPYPDAGVG